MTPGRLAAILCAILRFFTGGKMSDALSSPGAKPGAPDSGDEPLQFLDSWRVLVRRRAVVLTCLGAMVATSTLHSLFAEREYEAVATIQIERHGPDVLNFRDVVSVDRSWSAYEDFYQTQYEILQSRAVLRIAVERLDLPNRPEFVGRRRSPVARARGWLKASITRETRSKSSDTVLPLIGFLQAGLRVQPVRNSHLVLISFRDANAALAADVVNAVADAYLQFDFDSRYSTTAQAAEFLTKEVARLQTEIAEMERKLQDLGTRKEILALSDGTQDISEQALSDLNSRYVDAQGRLALAAARDEAVRKTPVEALPEVLNSPLIANLRQQHAEVERRYRQMAERFKEDWPPLRQLKEELDGARERLEIESSTIARQVRGVARAEHDRIRTEVERLALEVASQKGEVQRVNRDAIEYASLQNEVETRRKVLAELVARQSETATSERLTDTRASNIRVVDAAEPPVAPIRPKKFINFALSFFFGLGIGGAMAFLLEHLDNTVKSEQDVERWAALPALGHVPLFQPLRAVRADENHGQEVKPSTVDLASHFDSRSPFAESFKNLRTSLLLASPERPPRSIVVTSAEAGDGKSTIALNLAVVLTQLGRRVLVLDGDLRRPRLHRMLAIPNDVGLSSLLSGNAEPQDAIQETEVPNLRAIPSGPIPPNPSELLGSPALERLMERLLDREGFDHVVVDSPPAVQVADGVILSSAFEATILVVRAGRTAKASLALAATRLRQGRGRGVGAVLNGISEAGGYHYGYRYYRHHAEEGTATRGRAPSGRRRSRDREAGQA
mgnify:CR=1 FL=1